MQIAVTSEMKPQPRWGCGASRDRTPRVVRQNAGGQPWAEGRCLFEAEMLERPARREGSISKVARASGPRITLMQRGATSK